MDGNNIREQQLGDAVDRSKSDVSRYQNEDALPKRSVSLLQREQQQHRRHHEHLPARRGVQLPRRNASLALTDKLNTPGSMSGNSLDSLAGV